MNNLILAFHVLESLESRFQVKQQTWRSKNVWFCTYFSEDPFPDKYLNGFFPYLKYLEWKPWQISASLFQVLRIEFQTLRDVATRRNHFFADLSPFRLRQQRQFSNYDADHVSATVLAHVVCIVDLQTNDVRRNWKGLCPIINQRID